MFESRRKQSAHTVYRALLWTLVVSVATGVYLNRAPIVIEADQKAGDGITITREAESNVLLVLDYEAIRTSGPGFSERDFSAAWINLFEQTIGPVAIATPNTLSAKKIGAAQVIVLTSSVADQVPEPMLERFRQHVRKGGVVVVERPQGRLREVFSANGRAGEREGQALTFAKDMAEPYLSEMLQMPLSTQLVGSTAPRPGAVTHLAIDGAPAIYATSIDQGTAITVDFDLGEQLTAMQQGRPTQDYRVRARTRGAYSRENSPGKDSSSKNGSNKKTSEKNRSPERNKRDKRGKQNKEEDAPHTSALIMDPAMVNNPVPFADLLSRFIVHGVIAQYSPMPAFWPFPGGARGALIALHEDTVLGDGGGWMLDHESQKGAASTLLTTVDSGLSASKAATFARKGAELGLSYQKPGSPPQRFNRVGFAGFKPIAQPIGLAEQLKTLKKTLPSAPIRTVRTTGSWWDWEWSRPFELMAAQDLRIDTSYNPAPGAGYAFGTGFPFLVVNARGEPLGIRELPVVYPSGLSSDEGVPDLADLIAESARGHHQAITWSVPPSIFADYPDMERFEQWLSIFDIADEYEHMVTSVGRFDAFQRARRSGRIQSRVIRDTALPRSHAHALAQASSSDSKTKKGAKNKQKNEQANASQERATLLRITVNAKRRDFSLTVPETLHGKKFVAARKGVGRGADNFVAADLEASSEQLAGFFVRRVRLDAGFSTINVYYQ